MATVLKEILGSRSAELVLLFLYQFDEGHGRNISKKTSLSLESIQRRLKVLEGSGILKSKKIGNVILYSWDEENPAAIKLREFVGIIFHEVAPEEKEHLFHEVNVKEQKVPVLKNLNDFL